MARLLLLFSLLLLCHRPASAQTQPAESAAYTSADRMVVYTFANDAFFRTDYYFTQGMSLLVVLHSLRHSPVNKLLGPVMTGSVLHHGIQLHYDGFTPLRIQDPFIRRQDRPYASYIYADLLRVATVPARQLRLTSGLQVGIMGPAAGAKGFQTTLHEWLGAPTPRGWDYQIRNDVVLGYEVKLEKQLAAVGRGVELIGSGAAALSTLYTYAGAGARLRVGILNPYFSQWNVASRSSNSGRRRLQLYTEGQLTGRLVGYNATLQGGLLRSDNPYTLPARAINRAVGQATGTVGLGMEGVRLEASAVWISPEFRGARQHRWVQFGVAVAF
ncbi:lipid A-modifier LpxR family protein [Hymenobacter seoulensis]